MGKLVYLAGPITGLSYSEVTDWREKVKVDLADVGLVGLSPMRYKKFLGEERVIKDAYQKIPLASQRGLTTRDRFDVGRSDVILANVLQAQKVSLGTVLELGWADCLRKPIILVIEESGNCHDHAMLREISSFRVSDLDDAVDLVKSLLLE